MKRVKFFVEQSREEIIVGSYWNKNGQYLFSQRRFIITSNLEISLLSIFEGVNGVNRLAIDKGRENITDYRQNEKNITDSERQKN